jgi:hypothetical protein
VKTRSILRVTLSFLFGVTFFIGDAQTNQLIASDVTPSVVQNQSRDQPAVTTFAGKIVSQNGERFILRDDDNQVWYHLDDQQQAHKFFGKNVLVTGVLDGPTDTIRVRSIIEAKS